MAEGNLINQPILLGTLSISGNVSGNLSVSNLITGSITAQSTLSGMLSTTRVISGTLSNLSTIVGVIQSFSELVPIPYEGEYNVIPKAHENVVLETKDKLMDDDVTVLKVPYYETSNLTGETVYIASEV